MPSEKTSLKSTMGHDWFPTDHATYTLTIDRSSNNLIGFRVLTKTAHTVFRTNSIADTYNL